MKKNCHLRFRRHTFYWTGNGYQSFWGGWRNEKRCQECGHKLYVPGVRRSLPLDLQGDIEVGGIPATVGDKADLTSRAHTFPPPQGEARTCPYCPEVVYSIGEEIQHMERQHPEIIARRLEGL